MSLSIKLFQLGELMMGMTPKNYPDYKGFQVTSTSATKTIKVNTDNGPIKVCLKIHYPPVHEKKIKQILDNVGSHLEFKAKMAAKLASGEGLSSMHITSLENDFVKVTGKKRNKKVVKFSEGYFKKKFAQEMSDPDKRRLYEKYIKEHQKLKKSSA